MNRRDALYTVYGPKLLPEMTMKEVKEALEQTDTVVFAGASTEAHGNHLPLATDAIEAMSSTIPKLVVPPVATTANTASPYSSSTSWTASP